MYDEPRLVEVEYEGRWWPGHLLEWQRWGDGWRGYVTFTVAPGQRYLRWMPAGRIRER